MRAILLAISLTGLWAAAVPVAPAATVSVQFVDLNLLPDGTGQLDVSITGAGELTSLVGYEFRITPAVGTTSQLQFLEEDEAFLSLPAYLFAGNSAAEADALPSTIGTVSMTLLPGDTFVGGDSTADAGDFALDGTRLLVRLPVQHDAGAADPATTLGHSFSVSLVPLSGDSSEFIGGDANSGVIDAAFEGVAFQSAGGTVRVVPEPASMLLLVLGLIACFFGPRRSR